MPRRIIAYGIILGLVALSAVLGMIIVYNANSQDLRVIFFDVGQGDAILISQGNNQVLIDGGKDGKIILQKLGKYVSFWDRTIEAVIATHPDQDHIGGLVNVAKNYNVGTVLETGSGSDSQVYGAWENEISAKNIQKIEAVKDLTIKFPDGDAEIKILYPLASVDAKNAADSNGNSVVAKLNYAKDNFLFTGDLPAEKESALISEKSDLNSRVLKIAHHGSKYSSSEEFLNAVNPQEAVISVGKNNSYGHPAPEIINKLLKHGAKIWRTDEMGNITYQCKIKSEKCKVEFE
jgi:competence protein ComEC